MKKVIGLLLMLTANYCFSQDSSVTMSYNVQDYQSNALVVNIPPIRLGRTIIMKKAKVHAMVYNQEHKMVIIVCTIVPYSFAGTDFNDTSYIDNSNYGNEIITDDIKRKSVEIKASNKTRVNYQTGEILSNPILTDSISGRTYYNPIGIGEYDYFYWIAGNVPIKVNELITLYLQKNNKWEE